MGILGKIMFWKKDDEFSFDDMADKEMAKAGSLDQDNLGLDQKPPGFDEKSHFDEQPIAQPTPTYQQPQTQTPFQQLQQRAPPVPPQSTGNKDIDLINSKLDTIKAILQSMEQRLDQIDRSGGEKKQRLW